jgi:hypothetical protein
MNLVRIKTSTLFKMPTSNRKEKVPAPSPCPSPVQTRWDGRSAKQVAARHPVAGLRSTDIERRQALSRVGEARIPLRRVLANNGTALPTLDTQRVDGVELAANELCRGFQFLAERAEETLARPVGEDEARVWRNDEQVISGEDLVDDNLAVGRVGAWVLSNV